MTLAGSNAGLENIIDFSELLLSGSAATNYTLAGASGSVDVTPVPLTITPDPTNKIYGQPLTLSQTAFAITGDLVAGQTVTSVMLASAGAPSAAGVPGSPYSITVSRGAVGTRGFQASNYEITYATGMLTVDPLPALLDGTRDYDGTTNAAATILFGPTRLRATR